MSDFIKGFWPRSWFTWLGLIVGAMSVLALIQHGFNFGYGPAFKLLLTYYERLIHAAIGWWAEPFIKEWLAELSARIGWELQLHPHWKHVFVLMGIYFFRSVPHLFRNDLPLSGTFRLFWGLAVATIASTGAGTVALSQTDMWQNFLVAAYPVAGSLIFDLGYQAWFATFLRIRQANLEGHEPSSWLGYFSDACVWILRDTFLGLIVIVAALQLQPIRQLPNPGLAILAALVLLRALIAVWSGITETNRTLGRSSWSETFWDTGGAVLGTAMLGVFFWTGLFIVANAGLRSYGL